MDMWVFVIQVPLFLHVFCKFPKLSFLFFIYMSVVHYFSYPEQVIFSLSVSEFLRYVDCMLSGPLKFYCFLLYFNNVQNILEENLKLDIIYTGHPMQRTDSFEKTLML